MCCDSAVDSEVFIEMNRLRSSHIFFLLWEKLCRRRKLHTHTCTHTNTPYQKRDEKDVMGEIREWFGQTAWCIL